MIDFLGVEDGGENVLSEKNVAEILRLRLTIEGEWDGTIQFLGFLEMMPYKVTLERVSLVYISTKQIWNGSFNFTVFKLKEYVQES